MRSALITRKTKETDISLELNLDGSGEYSISTSIPFLDHMLELFARHGVFDLNIKATGDTRIDEHHLIEDMGIVLGEAIKKALGDKKQITRYGSILLPMDDTLVEVALDLSGRPFLVYKMILDKNLIKDEKEKYELYEHFFYSVSIHAGLNLHMNLRYGENLHHNLEAGFKGFARSLKQAVTLDPRVTDVPSTKGSLK